MSHPVLAVGMIINLTYLLHFISKKATNYFCWLVFLLTNWIKIVRTIIWYSVLM